MTPSEKAKRVFPDNHPAQVQFLQGALCALRGWTFHPQKVTLAECLGFSWVKNGRP